MSSSKQNVSDNPEEVSNPDPPGPETNKENDPTPTTDTQKKKDNTQISLSSKDGSHDDRRRYH